MNPEGTIETAKIAERPWRSQVQGGGKEAVISEGGG